MPELADVFRRHGPEYQRRFGARMPGHHRRAFDAVLSCRTPDRGGHLYECGGCRRRHFGYHSCNHRSCPKCGGADAAEWRQRRLKELLPVPYFLITFTLPAELRGVCRSNQRLFYKLLFEESAKTLQEIAANPKQLGAELGFLGVLHSWTRQLTYHPHIHYIVPGGGLKAAPDGRTQRRKWRKCRTTAKGEPYLLPVQVLSQRFRNRFAAALREKAPEFYQKLPASVWARPWVVHSQPAGSGAAAIGYLSAYVQRTALSNKRILSDDGARITLGYTESGTGLCKSVTFDPINFIGKVLQHVLPSGFHRVRYFGWVHPRARKRFFEVQTLLSVPLVLRAAEPPPHAPLHLRCPHCGQPALKIIARLRRPRPP
jgi:hypothetical protein